MKLQTILALNALVALLFAALALFAPAQLLTTYDLTMNKIYEIYRVKIL